MPDDKKALALKLSCLTTRIDRLINVCWELNKKNEKREFSGLYEAMKQFNVSNAQIIVSGYDDQVDFKGKKIVISNFFNWLKEKK